MVASNFDAT